MKSLLVHMGFFSINKDSNTVDQNGCKETINFIKTTKKVHV